jgi:drug/metabolite transporter (DMT)-like permease
MQDSLKPKERELSGITSASALPPRAMALVALLTLLWGTNWMLFPLAVREVSVWTFRSVAMLGAGLMLLAVARARGQSLHLPRAQRPRVVAAALVYLALWNVASTFAAVLIPSGQAALLGFTMPLWAALFAWLAWREPLTGRVRWAMLLGAIGVGLLMWRNLGAYAQAPLGVALGLLAGMGWAWGTLIFKRGGVALQSSVSATVLTAWQLLIAAVPVAIGAVAFADGPWAMPGWPSVLLITYIALVPMALGNLAWFSIVALLPANVAGLSSIMVPVVAMCAGALLHGEPLGLVQWAAMVCCVAALALALLRPRRVAP